MRVLGIDYGDKRIGLAITDDLGLMAHPLKVIDRSNDLVEIKKIIKEYGNIEKIVVGMPITLKDEISFKAKQVLSWIEKLKKEVDVPILTWDERFSTVVAEDLLIQADASREKRKKVIDKLAARVILQDYIDADKKDETR